MHGNRGLMWQYSHEAMCYWLCGCGGDGRLEDTGTTAGASDWIGLNRYSLRPEVQYLLSHKTPSRLGYLSWMQWLRKVNGPECEKVGANV